MAVDGADRVDGTDTVPDTAATDVTTERAPTPDRPRDVGFPSRVDSRHAANAANGTEQDAETPEPAKFTAEQITQLSKTEDDVRELAEEHGVKIDYTTHPIDPANARELNRAISR